MTFSVSPGSDLGRGDVEEDPSPVMQHTAVQTAKQIRRCAMRERRNQTHLRQQKTQCTRGQKPCNDTINIVGVEIEQAIRRDNGR